MRLIDASDLFNRLQKEYDKYKDSDDLIEQAIKAGIGRALTEIVLSPTEGRKNEV